MSGNCVLCRVSLRCVGRVLLCCCCCCCGCRCRDDAWVFQLAALITDTRTHTRVGRRRDEGRCQRLSRVALGQSPKLGMGDSLALRPLTDSPFHRDLTSDKPRSKSQRQQLKLQIGKIGTTRRVVSIFNVVCVSCELIFRKHLSEFFEAAAFIYNFLQNESKQNLTSLNVCLTCSFSHNKLQYNWSIGRLMRVTCHIMWASLLPFNLLDFGLCLSCRVV